MSMYVYDVRTNVFVKPERVDDFENSMWFDNYKVIETQRKDGAFEFDGTFINGEVGHGFDSEISEVLKEYCTEDSWIEFYSDDYHEYYHVTADDCEFADAINPFESIYKYTY